MRPGLAEALYRAALRVLPRAFRERHAGELLELFRRRHREARESGLPATARLALAETLDVVVTGLRLRVGAMSRGRSAAAQPVSIHPRRGTPMTGLQLDLRHAVRALVLRPAFSLTAVLTLAVGIGSATAIFTVVDAVLLAPLPYPSSERIAHVWRVVERYDMRRAPVSYPDFLDVRAATTSFEALSAYAYHSGTLLEGGAPERVVGARFEGGMFALLGEPVALGRPIQPADDAPGAEPVVVLGHGLWTRRFAADPGVIGRTVDLGEVQRRVVGVAAPGFEFPSRQVEYWVPLALDPATAERDSNFLQAIARLRPDADPAAAEAELAAALARIQEAHPGVNTTDRLWLEARHDYVVGDVRGVLLVLSAAVALLLALACANLASLLLVRAVDRQHELGVRAALGAAGGRLRRPLVTESLLLAGAGGALGVAGAWAAVRMLVAADPPVIPRTAEVALDARVLLFAVAISGLCALLCGWIPAWAAARRDPAAALRAGGRVGTGRRIARAQAGLVVTQVAIAAMLLLAAGLLGRSLGRLMAVPLGFDPEPVLTAYVAPPGSRYRDDAAVQAFYDDVLARLAATPGVTAAAGTWALPFSPAYASSSFTPEGGGEAEARTIALAPVRGDYFAAMGMRLLDGRTFTPADGADAPAVAVISETMARQFWPDGRAVGRRFTGAGPGGDEVLAVVGVVADVKRRSLDEDPVPEAYLPHAQTPWATDLYLTIRADGDPTAVAPVLRRHIGDIDPALPVTRVEPLTERILDSVAPSRLRTMILAALALAAGLLAVVGIYGVLSFIVARRGRDVAVRMALGAGRARVLGEVLRGGLAMAVAGLALGLVGGALAAGALEAFLFQVDPLDPVTFAAIPLLLLLAAAAAAWLPARRAAAVDPMTTLRAG